MENMWNKRYSEKAYIYGIEPNTFLESWLNKQKPSDILFPAEGEGRNAVYAATKDWNVTAFDSSVEGKKKALLLAKDHNVEIEYHISSAETYTTNKKFDTIVLIFAHFPPNFRGKIHENMVELLKPGGNIVLEAFSKDQIQHTSGGPKSEALLYSPEELKEDFNGLEIIQLEKIHRILNEDPLHQGKADVIQLVAKKML